MAFKTVLVHGSSRRAAQDSAAVQFIVHHLNNRGHEVVLANPTTSGSNSFNRLGSVLKLGPSTKLTATLARQIRTADGFIVLVGEDDSAPQPDLGPFLEQLLEEYAFQPIAVATYSNTDFSDTNPALCLQSLFLEMGMPTLTHIFSLPHIAKTVSPTGIARQKSLDKQVGHFLATLEQYQAELRQQRQENSRLF